MTADARRVRLPDGTSLAFDDNGAPGSAILFLHGALTDLRMWNEHRDALGTRFRTVAYTQRYHGQAPDAAAGGPPYGVRTHADDLLALIDALDLGPVHLVAWSYAGHVAFDAALRRPRAFRSLFVYEPGVPSYVEDAAEMQRFGQDARAAFGPVFEAMQAGDAHEALRRLMAASGDAPDCFERQPQQARALQTDNAHTLPRLLLQQEAPPHIGAAQLAMLAMPVAVGYGERSRPLYAVPAAAAQRCLPAGHHFVVPGQGHLWPQEDPAGFAARLVAFIGE